MNKTMKAFMSTSFAEVGENINLISLGLIVEDGATFYAEFNDYDKELLDGLIQDGAFGYLKYKEAEKVPLRIVRGVRNHGVETKGSLRKVSSSFTAMISKYDKVQIVSSNPSYDARALEILDPQAALFGHIVSVDEMIDIDTLLKEKEVDPNTNLHEFAKDHIDVDGNAENLLVINKNNALWDAIILKACYEKLIAKESR